MGDQCRFDGINREDQGSIGGLIKKPQKEYQGSSDQWGSSGGLTRLLVH